MKSVNTAQYKSCQTVGQSSWCCWWKDWIHIIRNWLLGFVVSLCLRC